MKTTISSEVLIFRKIRLVFKSVRLFLVSGLVLRIKPQIRSGSLRPLCDVNPWSLTQSLMPQIPAQMQMPEARG